MRSVGQLCLLLTLISAGYAAIVLLFFRSQANSRLTRLATGCGALAFGALCGAMLILAWALVSRDFSFAYVVHYSSRHLPWRYALSALWVGQAGSLLLWAWLLAALTVLFRLLRSSNAVLRDVALGVLLANVAFLAAILVFAADPFQASLGVPNEGLGLSPLLQHPSMLIHPPVIFCAYAAWTVPFALAMAALLSGQLDSEWVQMARPWAMMAWTVLLAGLLLGADWAYQELGWGGYWGWDPVENGSLLPWLTGTGFIHGLMTWRTRNGLKKSTLALGIATFALCNFATFLTRSGIFSSVHAFSESPIGWLFLGHLSMLILAGATLLVLRRRLLAPERAAKSLLARESLILASIILLVALASVVLGGTLVGPITMLLLGRTVVVDPAFYNSVLVPIGLVLLAVTAAVPLLRWGEEPGPEQKRILKLCLAEGLVAALVGYALGLREIASLSIVGLATVAVAAFLGAFVLDVRRRDRSIRGLGFWSAVGDLRRRHAGYGVHLGFMVLAIGIIGSALGTRRQDVDLTRGEVSSSFGRQIRLVELVQRELPDKLIAEAVLEISGDGRRPVIVRPARHLHLLQKEWTTEVAIHSSWTGDTYTVLNAAEREGPVSVTIVENPMMRWLWLGGTIACICALAALWPVRRRLIAMSSSVRPVQVMSAVIPPPRKLRRTA